jgi:hypothetical protein
MAEIIDIEVTGFTSLKAQIKAAQIEYQQLLNSVNATPAAIEAAAAKVGQLKDALGDANDTAQALGSNEGKFNAIATAAGSIASGFAAVQGAMGLVGEESENLQKTLLKVQSAMALAQGLQGLAGAADAFSNLKVVAVDAFKAIRAAIGSTGIGLLVIALGSVVVYWEDILELMNGVSAEQKAINAEAAKNSELAKKNLESLDQEEITLRRKGVAEEDIYKWKVAQYKAAIMTFEQELKANIATEQARMASKKYWSDFLNGSWWENSKFNKWLDKIIPESVKDAEKKVQDALKKGGAKGGSPQATAASFAKEYLGVSKEDQEKSDALIKGYQDQLTQAQNGLFVLEEDHNKKVAASKDEAAKLAAQKRKEAYDKEIENSRQRNQTIINDLEIAGKDTSDAEIKLLDDRIAIQKKYAKSVEGVSKELYETTEERDLKSAEITSERKKKELETAKEIAEAIANTEKEKMELDITNKTKYYDDLILLVKDDGIKQAELETSKQQVLQQIRDDYQKIQDDKENARKEKEKEDKNKLLEEQIAQNELDIEDEMLTFEEKLERNKANEELLNQMFFETESAKTQALRDNAEQRKAIEQAEFEFKVAKITAGMDLAMQAGQFLQQVAGKNKKLAIAGVVVEQAASIGKIIANTAVANAKAAAALPLTGGMPFVAINTVAAALSIASAIAAGVKAINQINAAESGGGGGGGAAPASAPPPSKFSEGGLATGRLHAAGGISIPAGEMEGGEYIVNRSATATFLPILESINSMGKGNRLDQGNLSSGVENQMMAMSQAPIVKTYVVASDMTSQQEANKRISDIARL